MTTPDLWHFTSAAQADRIDANGGWLMPANRVLMDRGLDPLGERGVYVWLIDEPSPTPVLVGFSDTTTHMAVRYRVVPPSRAVWWPTVRRQHSRAYVATLESHALPVLWWVSRDPVRVDRDESWTDPTTVLWGRRP